MKGLSEDDTVNLRLQGGRDPSQESEEESIPDLEGIGCAEALRQKALGSWSN